MVIYQIQVIFNIKSIIDGNVSSETNFKEEGAGKQIYEHPLINYDVVFWERDGSVFSDKKTENDFLGINAGHRFLLQARFNPFDVAITIKLW